MGGGTWDNTSYTKRSSTLAAQGYKSTFKHHEDIAAGKVQVGVHETLDPLKKCGPGSPHEGSNIREAMISDDHKDPTAVAVLFDVTGSMGTIPRLLQEKLPNLNGVLQRKGYVEDPQILFGAIGDARSDRVPLQVGQFESDNRMDEQLGNIYLEGNGGGHGTESYGLAVYYIATHTYLETFEREGKKGYLFTIGDERPGLGLLDTMQPSHVGHTLESLTGDNSEQILWARLKEMVEEHYEWFHLVITSRTYSNDSTVEEWRQILGERAIKIDDPAAVCEVIALTIGVNEGTTTLEDGMTDLKDAGSDVTSIQSASRALATIGSGAGGGSVVLADQALPEDDNDNGAQRL